MKLKKSSGSKISKAREQIAEQVDPDESTIIGTVGMILGIVVGLAALAWAMTTFMGEDVEEMT